MNNAKKRLVSLTYTAAAMAAMAGTAGDVYGGAKIKTSKKPTVTPSTERGYDHTQKSEEEKFAHKEHQKKLKARKNAKKGIHAKTFNYPKKRS